MRIFPLIKRHVYLSEPGRWEEGERGDRCLKNVLNSFFRLFFFSINGPCILHVRQNRVLSGIRNSRLGYIRFSTKVEVNPLRNEV